MRTDLHRSTLVVLALLLLVPLAVAPAQAEDAGRYRFEIEMTQAPPPDHAARGQAKVIDTETDTVIAAPGFVVGWGDDAVLESADPESGVTFRLDVAVAEDGATATWKATVHRDGALAASEEGEVPVALQESDAAGSGS